MRTPLILAVMLFSGHALANGDVLSMPPSHDGAVEAVPAAPLAVEMPVRGMSMRRVEARFGQPDTKLPAVGEPPITRWVYPDYTVYFEHQYTLHSVLKRR